MADNDLAVGRILGIRPMNQKDSAATPMFGAFTPRPDLTPFTAVGTVAAATWWGRPTR